MLSSPEIPEKKAAETFPPYFFHGAFAPSFIWCRRPWLTRTIFILRSRQAVETETGADILYIDHVAIIYLLYKSWSC